ncbi:MAG: hypothetical protein V4642_15010 [Bacteroidota bacterium]
MHGSIIILFFVISLVLGLVFSPLAQIAWLCVGSIGYVSLERFFSQKPKIKTPQAWVGPLTKQHIYFN